MIGRILFLTAAAFMAYRYVAQSNKKARELRERKPLQEILPPAVEDSATLVQAKPAAAALVVSPAAEPDPGR
jgi:hypothetical protein